MMAGYTVETIFRSTLLQHYYPATGSGIDIHCKHDVTCCDPCEFQKIISKKYQEDSIHLFNVESVDVEE